MWSDNETERDFLNFDVVATTVSNIIKNAGGQPVSIGVSGSWGVGKSSMIKLIRNRLRDTTDDEPAKRSQYVFVEFNAWLYQGYDDAKASLMDVIARAIAEEATEQSTGVEKAKDILRRINWLRLAKLGGGTIASLAVGLPPAGLLGHLFIDDLDRCLPETTISTLERSSI
jgi:predicted KAP-like P-loop ATPase